ncbi:unnamed protein product [Escherichia phage slur01]|uniref:hypothetical protein n=1 Tax=Escherichia phage slur01 TaxID=1720493 RepID=UPI0006C93B8B|nr:hypothetical protein AVU05_gp23 [Escherichia phage slur01]CUL01061.1 unnamed protein product [Escherichia phage slur01]
MSYQLALEAAGCEVLDYVEYGCYQGEWLALIRKDGALGVCEGSYGSCLGCDAFEAEFGYLDDEEADYQKRLADFGEGYLPANTFEEMIAKLQKDVENYSYDDDYKSMLNTVINWQKQYGV